MPNLNFDNAFIRDLPGDPEAGPRLRQVSQLWSSVEPTPVETSTVLAYSELMLKRVGLTEADVSAPWFAQVFGGHALLPGMQAYAANYGGHQFGHWAGQLGDGRAITLGEVINNAGERWELQLKGAGPTPYSRSADGRAVLRSSIREFLCSEAMHHLGVPTTRALSLVSTGETVVRDMFYDGNAKAEPGAVVCRVAPSFIRFGNFELPASRGDVALLGQLVDFCIGRDFPHLAALGLDQATLYAAWFREVCERTAVMVGHWMRVGFVHGVMNTDNMSILGLTIDYGPYGWIDNYDPDWTPNTTDIENRRYRFGQQPQVAYWNLGRLAGALAPLFPDTAPLQAGLQHFVEVYSQVNHHNAASKLGLDTGGPDAIELMDALLKLMSASEVDMTLFFRALADVDLSEPTLDPLRHAFYDPEQARTAEADFLQWLSGYAARVEADPLSPAARRALMLGANPRYVLRNYLAQQAIDRAEQGDASGVMELLDVMRHPYDEQPGREQFAQRRPDWARQRAGCSMLSCSS